jgi:uncharacterized protein
LAGKATYEHGLWNGKPLRDWVGEVVNDIVGNFEPRQVILFGSVARGEEGPDSDIDVLVVFDHVGRSEDRFDLAAKVRRCIRAPVPVEVFVTDPKEIELRRDVPGSFHYWPLREGKVMYERAA